MGAEMKLVEGWRKWYKFWSVQLGILGALIVSTLTANPTLALDLWGMMPQEFKSLIPPNYMPLIGVVIFFFSMVSKFIVQSNLPKKVTTDDPA